MAVEEKTVSGVRSGRMHVGRNLIDFKINHAALAYAMTTLGATMINNIFSFYYVKLFINKYKTTEAAFHQSQVSKLFVILLLMSYVFKERSSSTSSCVLL